MNYIFDLVSVTPPNFRTKYAGLLSRFELEAQARQQLAMFRDCEAATALTGACETVRDCFVQSGFALNAYQHEGGANEYEPTDRDMRAQILAKLQENVEALPFDVDWNGFDIGDFFIAAYGALPAPRKQRANVSTMTLMPSNRVLSRISRVLTRPVSHF
ncbi:MAG: hypothetical protein AAFR73_06595 [Pseudomonadota bacterium]